MKPLTAAILVLVGVPAGIGAFTFGYAKGFSYLSSDPRACINCHVMNEQFDAWQKSGHRHVATCIECHLPHDGLGKWVAKADHGWRHSVAFTLQDFKEPIEMTPADRVIVLENCVRCHGDLVESIHVTATATGEELDCLRCHALAGHSGG
ncbi:MAG TPA: cytochrome c nitrite reductase small subunit [Planctomycetota bacterium]|nr:cytochrome c nitrite reductase small subunit [Planctomycetota bacterium]